METHPSLTVLPESLELGEIRGTQPPNNNTTTIQNGGQVLDDISVTHILTLPTSASVQVRKKDYYIDIIIKIFDLIDLACSNNASTQ
jgi:hypothetical protein